MIVHFMNNFLSNYFYYGSLLDWPLAKFINFITNIFTNSIFIYSISSIFLATALICLYIFLLKKMLKERAQAEIKAIVKAMQINQLTLVQAQIRFNEVNQLLKYKQQKEQAKEKQTFSDQIFLICSIVLGGLITISSFIWGII